ncbi:MAG: hypothetical protein HYU66_05630, partial [Armatimonadetes bacterium]|nr:hypothetical protein [Armatimonadota bacterium]
EAVSLLEPLVAAEPDNAQAWMYLGAALGQLAQWPEAARALREVVRLQPEQASSYCDLAAALLEVGDRASAGHALDSALLLEPGHPVALRLKPRAEPPPEPAPTADAQGPENPEQAARRELAARRQEADERFGLAPAQDEPPRRLLPWLTAVLGVLLLVVAVKLIRIPGESWRQLRQAAFLLDRVAQERARLANNPGEDFESFDKVTGWEDQAEQLMDPAATAHPEQPEVHWLQGRLAWYRERNDLVARNHLLEALARLATVPDTQRLASRLDTAVVRAGVYRDLAEITLAGGRTAADYQRAADYLNKAHALVPQPWDDALQRRLSAAGRTSPPGR